jgi:hypothetical protein
VVAVAATTLSNAADGDAIPKGNSQMDIASVFLVVAAALLIATVWYAGVRKRAAVSGELQRPYAERAAETQRLLTDVSAQLADLNRRTADMQRIPKDAE